MQDIQVLKLANFLNQSGPSSTLKSLGLIILENPHLPQIND